MEAFADAQGNGQGGHGARGNTAGANESTNRGAATMTAHDEAGAEPRQRRAGNGSIDYRA
jgi:hypothetical protein